MPRVNVWLPEELHTTLHERLPSLNLSELVQSAIRGVLGCRHEELACATCAEPISRWKLIDDALGRFYDDLMWRLEEHLHRGGTTEGTGRVMKDVAERHQISAAGRVPLPRLSRAQRQELADRDGTWVIEGPRLPPAPPAIVRRRRKQQVADERVSDLPSEADSRARHPTARQTNARRRPPASQDGQEHSA